LCGQGRALRSDALIVGGIDAGAAVGRGELFVGLLFTNSVMSSGVFAGVTLSMNCHEGSSSTMELVSEWSGTGMLEADSMSFCEFVSYLC
jgi:hypothetical protein